MKKMYRRDVRKEVVDAWQKGVTFQEIHAKWGPSRGTVHNWTRGLARTVEAPTGGAKRKMDPALALRMEDEGKKRCEIATHFGVSPAAVTQALRKHLGLQPVARGSAQATA